MPAGTPVESGMRSAARRDEGPAGPPRIGGERFNRSAENRSVDGIEFPRSEAAVIHLGTGPGGGNGRAAPSGDAVLSADSAGRGPSRRATPPALTP